MNADACSPFVVIAVGERSGIFVLSLAGEMGLEFCADEDDFVLEEAGGDIGIVLRNRLIKADTWQCVFRSVVIEPEIEFLETVAFVKRGADKQRGGPCLSR